MILRCRLCHAAIAAFDSADLCPPLTGAMFGPLEPGFPPPFAPEADWEDARCPFCRHHPQGYEPAGREMLETDAGLHRVGGVPRLPATVRQPKEEN